jgi:hypothetical protein
VNDTHEPVATEPVDWGRARRFALLAAIFGFGAFAVLGVVQMMSAHTREEGIRDFFLTYLVGFTFWMCISLGGIALRTIHHLVGTSWGLILRPMFVGATKCLPLMAILFIPVAVSFFAQDNSPYWWAQPSADLAKLASQGDPNGAGAQKMSIEEMDRRRDAEAEKRAVEEMGFRKRNYLNDWFALARGIIYFAFWIGVASLLNRWVDRDRNGDPVAHEKLKNMSGPILIFWAIIGTFAITDWAMSLEPPWASTMFPVIFGVTCLLACLVFSASVALTLVRQPQYAAVVRDKHKIDIGSLMLALTMVWSYTSFSQFMLVWVANLPEEIPFFLKRTSAGWEWASRALCVLFFALPFLLLLFRDIKKNPIRLRRVALWLLFMACFNVMWWIVPALPHPDTWLHVPMAAAAVIGVGGLWGLRFIAYIKDVPLLTPHEGLMVEGEYHRDLHNVH